jgi:hypothetical protein
MDNQKTIALHTGEAVMVEIIYAKNRKDSGKDKKLTELLEVCERMKWFRAAISIIKSFEYVNERHSHAYRFLKLFIRDENFSSDFVERLSSEIFQTSHERKYLIVNEIFEQEANNPKVMEKLLPLCKPEDCNSRNQQIFEKYMELGNLEEAERIFFNFLNQIGNGKKLIEKHISEGHPKEAERLAKKILGW